MYRRLFGWSVPDFHDSAAAPGDDLPFLDMQDFVADGTVHVTFFLRPDDGAGEGFQFIFHKGTSLKKGGSFTPALGCFLFMPAVVS